MFSFIAEYSDNLSIAFGSASAVFWLLAAVVTPWKQSGFYGGPPKNVTFRLRLGAMANSFGAVMAAAMMSVQVIDQVFG